VKFVNFVKYGDLDKIAGARTAHFAYADSTAGTRQAGDWRTPHG
jgi:hypothetical protein